MILELFISKILIFYKFLKHNPTYREIFGIAEKELINAKRSDN